MTTSWQHADLLLHSIEWGMPHRLMMQRDHESGALLPSPSVEAMSAEEGDQKWRMVGLWLQHELLLQWYVNYGAL